MRIWIRDPESFDPGSGMEQFGSGINIRIRNTAIKSKFNLVRYRYGTNM